MKHFRFAGLLAFVALACVFACARALGAQTPVTSPLVLVCATAAPGASVIPWVNCSSGAYEYKPPAADSIVATDSITSGTWQRFGDIAATRLVRACPKGASISTDLKQCLNAAGTSGAMTFLSKALITGAAAPIATGNAKLTWVAPTANTDFSALVDLAGFDVYGGLSTPPQQKIAEVGASVLTYTVENLAPGQWFFGVKARTTAGIQSDLSPIASKTVANPVVPTLTFSVSPADGVEKVTPRIVWSTSNATLCSASGAWEGTQAITGDVVLPAITKNATYQLVCTGPGGEARATALVVVSTRPNAPSAVTVE